MIIVNNIFNWIEKKAINKYYIYYLTFILVCLSLFFASPKYRLFSDTPGFLEKNLSTAMLKSENLLDPLTHLDPHSHDAKTVFRLTAPVIIKIFHLNALMFYFLQFIIGIFFITQIFKLSKKLLNDSVSSTFLTSGLVFLYFGRVCFTNLGSEFDGLAFFFLIMVLIYKNPFVVFFFSTCIAWTDERAFLALPIVILFHQIDIKNSSGFDIKKIVSLNSSSIGVLVSMIFYITLRLFLTFYYDMHTPTFDVNLSVFKDNIFLLGIGIWSFLEGFWLLIIIFAINAFLNKSYLFFMAVFAQIILLTIIACCVFDITRSGSYIVPIVFVLISYLKNYICKNDIKVVLFYCFIVSFTFPAYFVVQVLGMNQPLYYELFYFIINNIF